MQDSHVREIRKSASREDWKSLRRGRKALVKRKFGPKGMK